MNEAPGLSLVGDQLYEESKGHLPDQGSAQVNVGEADSKKPERKFHPFFNINIEPRGLPLN